MPVFGLNVHHLGADNDRAVIVEVLASVDGPHLIYRGEYFGAPVCNDADTVWMKERQIEAMYRARFDERRHAAEALDALYAEARLIPFSVDVTRRRCSSAVRSACGDW